jgi:F-type H+-transporting ATPase subunit a
MAHNPDIQHEIILSAEPIFKIGEFTATNSWLNSIIAVFILVVFSLAIGKKAKLVPRGLQNFFEIILEIALGFSDTITGNRKNSEKLLPFVLSLFLFILVNNWLGIIPGVGTIGFVEQTLASEEKVFIPLFRGGTADLNTTLALAFFAISFTHILGIFTIGFWRHINKYLNFQGLVDIVKNFKKDKMIAFVNPIKFFVGALEILTEAAKVASLSLRLFGNIFAGEVLLTSMMAIFAYALPIPFLFLEVLVGIVQALIFSILVLVFASMSMQAEEH